MPAFPRLQGLKLQKQSEIDRYYMARALKLASRGLYTTYPNPAVGCIFVRQGRIIGEGWHHKTGQPHAEIMAINNAGGDVKGATAYVTLEPCSHFGRTPPCALRLVHEQVARVVVAAGDPNPKVSGRGIEILRKAGIAVTEHVLEKEAWFLNRAFMKSIVVSTPFVTLKVAMGIDCGIALEDGQSKWITDERSRRDVQKLRAQCDAVITSLATVLADNPRYSVRYDELPGSARMKVGRHELRQPLKVIIDSGNSLLSSFASKVEELNIFSQGKTLLCCGSSGDSMSFKNINEHTEAIFFPKDALDKEGHLKLKQVLEYLGQRQIRHVLVEAGPRLADAFLKCGLVDELLIYEAPKFLGKSSRRLFALDSPKILDDAVSMELYKVKRLDHDLKIHLLSHDLASKLKAFEEHK
ncbi:MAG: bifunctional diaminohydroxyphosphoribosylaminopyrimidine deaminase/5-amino-6-(5-phosphoribosylamino)uracil reductase RibD [Succinatimonas sp.]|nr:bifunctional diaminohydroxyphosphoribosylaminopyrimidine deaminase/5-amino-6-(5-phosphoribosylamino)uracil reductase RibD [Succinatimonas sp.]